MRFGNVGFEPPLASPSLSLDALFLIKSSIISHQNHHGVIACGTNVDSMVANVGKCFLCRASEPSHWAHWHAARKSGALMGPPRDAEHPR